MSVAQNVCWPKCRCGEMSIIGNVHWHTYLLNIINVLDQMLRISNLISFHFFVKHNLCTSDDLLRVSGNHSTHTYVLQIITFNFVATRELQEGLERVHLFDFFSWLYLSKICQLVMIWCHCPAITAHIPTYSIIEIGVWQPHVTCRKVWKAFL